MKGQPVGCVVAAILAFVVIAALGVVAFYSLFNLRVASEEDEMERASQSDRAWAHVAEPTTDDGPVTLSLDKMRSIPLPAAGEELTRERFVVFMVDQDTTELTKQAFREVASEATVNWLLWTRDVMDTHGDLRGEFQLPWQMREGNQTSSSSISVQAEFTDESRPDLLGLRRGDWVTVQGQLSFKGNASVVLRNARLAPKPGEEEGR